MVSVAFVVDEEQSISTATLAWGQYPPDPKQFQKMLELGFSQAPVCLIKDTTDHYLGIDRYIIAQSPDLADRVDLEWLKTALNRFEDEDQRWELRDGILYGPDYSRLGVFEVREHLINSKRAEFTPLPVQEQETSQPAPETSDRSDRSLALVAGGAIAFLIGVATLLSLG